MHIQAMLQQHERLVEVGPNMGWDTWASGFQGTPSGLFKGFPNC